MRHERIDLKRSYVKRSQGRYKIQNLKNHESQPCIQELHAIRAPLLSAKFVTLAWVEIGAPFIRAQISHESSWLQTS